ncbi:MAG: exo-alpha-sialidase, partial [Anaerolineae bacterium]|nr:exo-alpha-sialidase [Anaerolineae bacterium]
YPITNKLTFPTGSWLDPIPLFISPYFRELTVDNSRVRIILNEVEEKENVVFAIWENRPRNRIQIARSEDNGKTWGEAKEISNPESNETITTPVDVDFTIVADRLMVIWKNKFSDTRCQQVYQLYSLGGQSLGQPIPMLTELLGCPEDNQLVTISDDLTLLSTKIFNNTYFLAWDGEKWSLPQIQLGLTGIVDPETLLEIDFGCYQPRFQENRLTIVGCDAGDGGDIWVTSTLLDIDSDWFSKPSAWTEISTIISSGDSIGPISITADQENNFHAVWVQNEDENPKNSSIYYARWVGGTWSFIKLIIAPPEGIVKTLSMEIDSNSRLHLVWSGGASGEIYYSWANANGAWNSKEWKEPIVLPMVSNIGSSADILINEENNIFVVYTIPINEDRGVYITSSSDNGDSWETPTLLLDGTALGWEIVAQASITGKPTSKYFVLVKQEFLLSGTEKDAIYSIASPDQGQTWSSPELMSDANPMWGYILPTDDDNVYRIWQQGQSKNLEIWLDHSTDGGASWSTPYNFSEPGTRPGKADLVVDPLGNIHLLQLTVVKNDTLIREWMWEGTKWNSGEDQLLTSRISRTNVSYLEVGLSSDAFLGVLTTRPIDDTPESGMELVFTGRQLDIDLTNVATPSPDLGTPDVTAIPDIVDSPTQTPESEEPSIIPTKNSETTTQNLPSRSINGVSSEILGPAIGLIAAGLIVLLTLSILYGFSKRIQ